MTPEQEMIKRRLQRCVRITEQPNITPRDAEQCFELLLEVFASSKAEPDTGILHWFFGLLSEDWRKSFLKYLTPVLEPGYRLVISRSSIEPLDSDVREKLTRDETNCAVAWAKQIDHMYHIPRLPEPLLYFASAHTALAEQLDRIESLWGRHRDWWGRNEIAPNTAEAHRIEYTYHSNAIEGSTLTLRETQLIIEGKSLPGGKSMREVYEARNHDRAVRRIESWVESEHSPAHPLDELALLELHGIVLADIMPGEAGAYRSGRVRIAGSRHIPPGPHRFDELMPAALGRLNNPALHPVLRAAELHYNLVAVHPFADGNGRTARLMMNAHLLQCRYPLCIIEVERRAEYLTALDAANTGDPLPFAAFIVGCVERSLRSSLGEDGPAES